MRGLTGQNGSATRTVFRLVQQWRALHCYPMKCLMAVCFVPLPREAKSKGTTKWLEKRAMVRSASTKREFMTNEG